MTDSTQEIAAKMMKVWDERGWTRHMMEDYNGHVCALGALHVALFGNPILSNVGIVYELKRLRGPVVVELTKYLPKEFYDRYMERWNILIARHDVHPSQIHAAMLAHYNDDYGYEAMRAIIEKAAIPAQEMIEVAL
jgi:hypothetical protein